MRSLYVSLLEKDQGGKVRRTLLLGDEFIGEALRKPDIPKGTGAKNRFFKTPKGRILKVWDRTSNRQKIKLHLEVLAEALNCNIVEFELI